MEIVGAIQSLKLAKDVLKAFRSLQVTAEVQGKLMELQGLVSDAYTATIEARADQLTMQDQIHELKSELMKFENWETEKERYELKEVVSGRFVYATKEPVESGEPPHKICPNCYGNRIKTILQFEYRAPRGGGGRLSGSRLECLRCNFAVSLS